MTGTELFWSGVGGAVLGAAVGPVLTEFLSAHRHHRDSLRAVLGEIRADVSALRSFLSSIDDDPSMPVTPIQVAPSTAVMTAMSGEISAWGEGTTRHVMIFYDTIRRLQRFADDHRAAVIAHGHAVHEINAPDMFALASAHFVGLRLTAEKAVLYGGVAEAWMVDELDRLAEWQPVRSNGNPRSDGASRGRGGTG